MAAAALQRGESTGRRGGGGAGVWRCVCFLLHVPPFVWGPAPAPRYSLVPLRAGNETFLIHLHPPSIHGLRVHSRQSVSFNCTLVLRHWQPRRPRSSSDSSSDSSSNGNGGSSVSGGSGSSDGATTHGSSSSSHLALHSLLHTSVLTPTTTTTTTAADRQDPQYLYHHYHNPHHHPNDTDVASNDTDSVTAPPLAAAWVQQQQQHQQQQGTKPSYWAMIFSSDDNIAQPVWSSNGASARGLTTATNHALLLAGGGSGTTLVGGGGGGGRGGGKSQRYLLMAIQEGEQHNFSIQALRVGRVTMSVAVVGQEAALLADNGQLPHNNVIQAVATSHFPVTTVRGQRTADLVFDSSAAAIAILITFGMGCCTDTDSVKRQLKFPVSLIIGFCCQFILMPVLAFGLAMVLPIEKDIRFGLLCTACVPGGGLGHIAVVIGDADVPLSLTMNLISVVAMLGTAPLWIFVLGQYFQTDPEAILSPRIIPIYNFEIWLASIFLAYSAGLLVNRFRPVVADMLLMWIIKPFLLLATILYITVGVYINMYVFELINHYAVLGAILLPLMGCVLGCSLAALCRQRAAFVKTIALETSSLNCLMVLAALRFSLQQPDADLASTIPIWVMFTIPGLYVALAILRHFYTTVHRYWTNRRSSSGSSVGSGGEGGKDSPTHSKDYDVAAAIVTRPGIAALSAPLVVADGVDDDPGHSEKVTVL